MWTRKENTRVRNRNTSFKNFISWKRKRELSQTVHTNITVGGGRVTTHRQPEARFIASSSESSDL